MVLDLLANKVIGVMFGKMEFGPRALCNRSIIYRTSDKTINQWLNKRMKRTEFMPFAPIIREETAKIAFKNFDKKDPSLTYMTSTVDCKDVFSQKSPAVCHIDKTARPQIISKKENPLIWNLLKIWENKTRELSLVNTSFNVHEEPIVCFSRDALKNLDNKVVDCLYIEDYKITI